MTLAPLETPQLASSPRQHVGVFRGVVVENVDPLGMGRVSVLVPSVTGGQETLWAVPVVPMAAPGAGTRFVPQPGDVAIVAFEAGDPRFPVVLGYYWDRPASAPQPPFVHVLRGRTEASVEISEVPPTVTLRSGESTITVSPEGVTIVAGGAVLSLTADGIAITGTSVSITAGEGLELTATDVATTGATVSTDAGETSISAGTCRIEAGLVTIN